MTAPPGIDMASNCSKKSNQNTRVSERMDSKNKQPKSLRETRRGAANRRLFSKANERWVEPRILTQIWYIS